MDFLTLWSLLGFLFAVYAVTANDSIQTLDLIQACGDAEAFCRSNILKYASRYDRKGSAKMDLLKIMHYAVLLYHFNQKDKDTEIYPQ